MESYLNFWGKVNIAASVVSAISAAIVGGIALWGVFFTSIPDKLIGKLNSEVSEAKTSLDLVKKQRIDLMRQVDDLSEKRNTVESENKVLLYKNQKLKGNIENLNSRIENLSKTEKERRKLYVSSSISLLKKSLRDSLSGYKKAALLAANYADTRNWVESQPDKGEPGYSEWFNKLPNMGISSFQDTIFDDIAIASGNTAIKPSKKRLILTTRVEEMIRQYDVNKPPITGVGFIFEALNNYQKIENDKFTFDRVSEVFKRIIANNPSLHNGIEPMLLHSFSVEEIVSQGNESLKTIRLLESIIDDFNVMVE
jgi:hypothetical protein